MKVRKTFEERESYLLTFLKDSTYTDRTPNIENLHHEKEEAQTKLNDKRKESLT